MALWILPVGLDCAIGAKANVPFVREHSKIKCAVEKILKTYEGSCFAKLVYWSVSNYSETSAELRSSEMSGQDVKGRLFGCRVYGCNVVL